MQRKSINQRESKDTDAEWHEDTGGEGRIANTYGNWAPSQQRIDMYPRELLNTVVSIFQFSFSDDNYVQAVVQEQANLRAPTA